MTATSSASANASTGCSVFGLAFAVLFVLKVAGLAGASWGLAELSWWWVFSPILIGFGIFFLVLAIVFFGALLVAIFGK